MKWKLMHYTRFADTQILAKEETKPGFPEAVIVLLWES